MKKIMILAAVAVLSAAPTSALAASGVLHSYSSKPLTMEVGLCNPAGRFPFSWLPCFWV